MLAARGHGKNFWLRTWGVSTVFAVSLSLFTGCPQPPVAEQLNPSFTANVRSGSADPDFVVEFTNTSTLGGDDAAKAPAITRSAVTHFDPVDSSKAPQRTSNRGLAPSARFAAGFSLDIQGEVAVGAAITATNTSTGDTTTNWEVLNPGGASVFTATQRDMPSVVLPSAGDYTIRLVVTNALGFSDGAQASVTAIEQNQGPGVVEEATYRWDFGDGSPAEEIALTGDVAHAYTAPGTYTVSLTMTRGGESATRDEPSFIRVFDVPDRMEFVVSRNSVATPNAFSFADSTFQNESPDDEIVMWMWDFGDGQTAATTEPDVDHDYDAPGIYTVMLTVVTENGGEATVARSDVVQVLSVDDASDDPGEFDIESYLSLNVGNRWTYRSTGDTSFLPFHFGLSVVAVENRIGVGGIDVRIASIAVNDALDRNNLFFIGEVGGALYAFLDEVALDFYVAEGQLEPFFSFPLFHANVEPRQAELLDPEQGPLLVEYEQGSLFDFLPRLLDEEEYLELLAGPDNARKGNAKAGGNSHSQPRQGVIAKHLLGGPLPAKNQDATAKAIEEMAIGIADQPDSIAVNVAGSDIIPYVLSPGVGITYLVGSALAGNFPLTTIGPGTESFAIQSTYTLQSALVKNQYIGGDDHNNVSNPLTIFDQAPDGTQDPSVFPTVLLPNFGELPGHLTEDDVDVFYLLTSSTEIGVPYRVEVNAASGATLVVELREINETFTALLEPALLPANFTQTIPFSEFILTVAAPAGEDGIEYTVELISVDDHADEVGPAATPIAAGQSLQGNLEVGDDLDVFRFDVLGGMTYTVETGSTSFSETDTILSLLDGGGVEVDFNDDGGFGLFSRIVFTASETGEYFAVVGGFDDSIIGAYTVTLLEGVGADPSVDDHGDDIANATTMAVDGATVPGNLEEFGDIDVFAFVAIAGEAYVVETSSSSGTDTFIFLFAGNSDTFFFNDDGGENLSARIVFRAALTETLFIEVQGFQDREAGRYEVGVSTTTLADDFPDDLGSAFPVTVGGETISGALNFFGDVDVFGFDAVEGDSYVVATSGEGLLTDTFVQIVDGAGNVLFENDDAGATLFATVVFTSEVTGPLFVLVRGFEDSEAGGYDLTVGIDDHANGFDGATVLVVDGDPPRGVLEGFGDFDWFSFQAVAGENYDIRTGQSGRTVTDTVLYLLDAAGDILSDSEDGEDGFSSQIVWPSVSNETLFVVVGGFEDSVIGSYTIAVASGAVIPDDHGDDTETATDFVLGGGALDGVLEVPTDRDVFAFDAVAGQTYSIETFGAVALDTIITLLDSTGNVLAENDDGFGAFSYLFITASEDGTLFVEVTGFAGVIGEYTLLIRNDDHADNTFDLATPYSVGGASIGGILEVEASNIGGDYDLFVFDVVLGSTYRIETLAGIPTLADETDTVLSLFDDFGNLLENNDDRDGGTSLTSEIIFTADYTGAAFARVEGFGGASGTYAIRVAEIAASN